MILPLLKGEVGDMFEREEEDEEEKGYLAGKPII